MMANDTGIIDAYRDLEGVASRMVVLAREEDWDAVVAEGEHYVAAVAAIAEMERGAELAAEAREAKHRFLERTLDYDLEIRTRLIEQREALARMIALSSRERALAEAYGTVTLVSTDRGRAGPLHP